MIMDSGRCANYLRIYLFVQYIHSYFSRSQNHNLSAGGCTYKQLQYVATSHITGYLLNNYLFRAHSAYKRHDVTSGNVLGDTM